MAKSRNPNNEKTLSIKLSVKRDVADNPFEEYSKILIPSEAIWVGITVESASVRYVTITDLINSAARNVSFRRINHRHPARTT